MQLNGYEVPQVDVNAVPGLVGVLSWAEANARRTAQRIHKCRVIVAMAGRLHDDIALEAKEIAQGEQLLLRGVTRRVSTATRA